MVVAGAAVNDATVPVNADTLGGRPANDYVTDEEVVYYSGDIAIDETVPLNADTLQGYKASDFATADWVKGEIANAQLGGGSGEGEIDLSGFALKTDVSAEIDNKILAIDYPVDSVNGKTGAVTLSASDIGARANTWMPSASDVSAVPTDRTVNGKALSSNITLSASDVGAAASSHTHSEYAPAGYGLGENNGKWVTDINSAIVPGFYAMGGDSVAAKLPAGYTLFGYGSLLVERRNNHVSQTFNYKGRVAHRYSEDAGATWSEFESENPPLEAGFEYRTTERIQDKAVYKRTSNHGRIEYRLDGETVWHPYTGNGIAISEVIQSAGWYKIGTFNATGPYSAAVTKITIGGDFNNFSPYSAIVEINSGYGWSKAITTLPTYGGIRGLSKIATVSASNGKYDLYGYYNGANYNTVQIIVDAPTECSFVSANFEAASSFNESTATSVADVTKSAYAPNGYGLGDVCVEISDWNNATKNGFYISAGNSPDGNKWWGFVVANSANYIEQRVFRTAGGILSEMHRSKYNGTWQSWKKAGVTMDCLWTNASPTSIFTEQTISVNWSKYDKIAIQYNTCYAEIIAKLGSWCDAAYYFGNDNGSVVVNHRQAEAVSGGIKIGNCQVLTTSGYITANDRVIPQKIYGIKGVN